MPRITRNFWVDVDIDGRRTQLSGGPCGRRGEFSATFYIRDQGSVLRAVAVTGRAMSDGTLSIDVSAAGDVAQSTTGHIEPGASGFTVTTQAGYKPERQPRRNGLPNLTRELLTEWPTPTPMPPLCRYLTNEVPTREACSCQSCVLVLDAEAERERQAMGQVNPLGIDSFGIPYA
jgi:hypothetical protein